MGLERRIEPAHRLSKLMKRFLTALAVCCAGSFAFAGTLIVTSPSNGDYLGKSNTLSFQLKGSNAQAEVKATITLDGNSNEKFEVSKRFTPDKDGNVTDSLTLAFGETTSQGNYTIVVTVDEPNNTYNPETRNVVVDVKDPEFTQFFPIDKAFVRKGIIPIRVKLNEPNMKEYRVQIDDQDIPNNSGDVSQFVVNWDTTRIEKDGPKTIKITAKDKANNSTTKTVTVTLDSLPPVVSILAPRGGTIRPGQQLPVALDVADQFTGSIDLTGIDVTVRRMDGTFIRRVARQAFFVSASTIRWTGRLKYDANLPNSFKLRVTAIDRATNVAAVQEVTVTVAGRGRGGR